MAKRDKNYYTKWRANRKALGLCPTCGDKPDSPKHLKHLKQMRQERKPMAAETKVALRSYQVQERRNRKAKIAALRALLSEIKVRTGCAKCGERHAACLEFHHRDQAEKDERFSTMVGRLDLVGIVAELAKCDVLCANCHKKHHYDTRSGPWTQKQVEESNGTPTEGQDRSESH